MTQRRFVAIGGYGRIPHVRAIINRLMELGNVICVANHVVAAARDAEMLSAARAGRQIVASG